MSLLFYFQISSKAGPVNKLYDRFSFFDTFRKTINGFEMKSTLFIAFLSIAVFIFSDPEQLLFSSTWCSATDGTSCFEFKKGELIFIRDEQVSDRVSLSKSSSGEDWIVYTINEQSHIQNRYMLLSKDSLLVRQIDYGIESKRASLYLRK